MKDGAVNPSVAVEVDNEDEEGVACDDDERGRENAAQQYCKKVGALEGQVDEQGREQVKPDNAEDECCSQ